METEVLTVTVSQLNNYIKRVMENNSYLKDIWVKGEISNFKLHYSGHIYMTLKDDHAAVRAVMFRGAAARLRFQPENGMKAICRGRVSVYERDGQYQLYVEEIQPDGLGALHMAFEQLKQKLGEEGLFDDSYKKPLPPYPSVIGVVTAPTGAAVRDIIHVLGRRFPLARVRICPVLVQGEQAAGQIAAAIHFLNQNHLCDVIIAGRGGGSIEDLWAFNEEIVARAVFASEIPVISAVGHETDFTICDFVADRRAPTPSAAAEIAVPSVFEVAERIAGCGAALLSSIRQFFLERRSVLSRLQNAGALLYFPNTLADKRVRTDALQKQLEKDYATYIRAKREKLSALCGRLDALSPLKVLARGYAIASDENGRPIVSVSALAPEKRFSLRLADGSANCCVLPEED